MYACMHVCMYVMKCMYVDHVFTIFTNVVPGLLRGTAYSPWIPKSSACHESELCWPFWVFFAAGVFRDKSLRISGVFCCLLLFFKI